MVLRFLVGLALAMSILVVCAVYVRAYHDGWITRLPAGGAVGAWIAEEPEEDACREIRALRRDVAANATDWLNLIAAVDRVYGAARLSDDARVRQPAQAMYRAVAAQDPDGGYEAGEALAHACADIGLLDLEVSPNLERGWQRLIDQLEVLDAATGPPTPFQDVADFERHVTAILQDEVAVNFLNAVSCGYADGTPLARVDDLTVGIQLYCAGFPDDGSPYYGFEVTITSDDLSFSFVHVH